ncbi:uncharacterized protein LOC132985384 [Labrus mixtus]|uniref:uncharacterized protein LOC132985384 n=1 Tax=Labrus mixtus TaxID=508554 RepID=UPI0029C0D219|nr:uncharacterized protein LOC132985384 [Labrus mixtus]
MNELKWIQTSLLLTALLQFAATAFRVKRVTFRVGEDATLSCETATQDQQKCEYTTWYLDLGNNAAVELVLHGQVINSRVKSDRLRVTEDCSLVIKKITEEDARRYDCLQDISGRRTSDVTRVHLSVIKSKYFNLFKQNFSNSKNKLKHYNNYKDSDEVNLSLVVFLCEDTRPPPPPTKPPTRPPPTRPPPATRPPTTTATMTTTGKSTKATTKTPKKWGS